MEMSVMPTILTMKWGTLFSADYVNVLFNACRAASRRPFHFVCFTDDRTGLLPDIQALPLPDCGLAPDDWYHPGVWPKIGLYQHKLEDLHGRALFIDLDMMVLRDLDSFFDHTAPFITTDMGSSWRPGAMTETPEAGTCLFAFSLGQEKQILEAFAANPKAAMKHFQNEQDFVSAHASSMAYWPDGWVISFKRWLRRPIGLDLLQSPKAPPASAKILAFHGKPRPGELLRGGINFWDRFPHMGRGRVSWMADYWTNFGGRLP
jgi:hypothetical protein